MHIVLIMLQQYEPIDWALFNDRLIVLTEACSTRHAHQGVDNSKA